MNKKKWIYGLILIGLLVRLYLVFNVSVWWDEEFSINTLTSSWIRIISGRVDPGHPPGYYLLLKMWSLISKKVVWLRLMSVLFYGLNSWLLYKIGKKVKDDSFALILLAGYCFSGYFVTFDWQIRMYSGLLSFILGSIWWSLKKTSNKNLVAWMSLNVLGLWFDYGFFWYFLPSIVFWMINKDWKKWLTSLLSLSLFGYLWGGILIKNFEKGLHGIEWLNKYGFTKADFFIPFFLGWAHKQWRWMFASLIVYSLWGLAKWVLSKDTTKVGEIILLSSSVSLTFSYLASRYITPLLHIRSLQIVGLSVLWLQAWGGYSIYREKKYWLIYLIGLLMVTNFLLAIESHFFHLSRMIA